MFQLRRSALRLLTNSTASFATRSRTISSISHSAYRFPCQSSFSPISQRRWASDDAQATGEKPTGVVGEGGETPQEDLDSAHVAPHDLETGKQDISEDAPVSKEVPAPEDEVEAAIEKEDADHAAAETFETRPAQQEGQGSDPESRRPPTNAPIETLYVGNLYFDVSDKDLAEEFSRVGSVQRATIIRDPRGFSKGFGYVTFDSVETAKKAQEEFNQQVFEGRRMNVSFAFRNAGIGSSPPRHPVNAPTKTLFIGNLSFEMTDRDLNNLFKGIKNVIDVRVAVDRRTGQPRGFAHADFISVKAATEAHSILAQQEVYGRKLRVDFSRSKDEGRSTPGSGGAM